MNLDLWKAVTQIASQSMTIVAAIAALIIYWNNSRLERAKWAVNLYERFFEKDGLKEIRDLLDCDADSKAVQDMVSAEGAAFTDYLNFFEMVAILKESDQLKQHDVENLFGYYLKCLKKHKVVSGYIRKETKGYEKLRKLLGLEGNQKL